MAGGAATSFFALDFRFAKPALFVGLVFYTVLPSRVPGTSWTSRRGSCKPRRGVEGPPQFPPEGNAVGDSVIVGRNDGFVLGLAFSHFGATAGPLLTDVPVDFLWDCEPVPVLRLLHNLPCV